MPTLKPVEIKNQDDSEPVTIPFVAVKGEEKVTTAIRFAGRLPAGVALDMIKVTNAAGQVDFNAAVEYVDGCVLEEDRELWDELIHSTEIIVEQSHLLAAYAQLGEYYTNRPTKRRSVSRTGAASTKPTSRSAVHSPKPTPTNSR
jgi:hypothetical protein